MKTEINWKLGEFLCGWSWDVRSVRDEALFLGRTM
jgi:hypothetical protein